MKVKRIVSNVATSDVDKAGAFYKEVLGLEVLMDLGWIRTYGLSSKMTIQVSVMSEGGVRRFYVRDPFGELVNILQHQE